MFGRDSQEVLRRTSGISQEALTRFSKRKLSESQEAATKHYVCIANDHIKTLSVHYVCMLHAYLRPYQSIVYICIFTTVSKHYVCITNAFCMRFYDRGPLKPSMSRRPRISFRPKNSCPPAAKLGSALLSAARLCAARLS